MKYVIGAIIAIGLFISGLLIGKFHYAKTEIKIEKVKVKNTVWKDKHQKLKLSKPIAKEKISVDDLNDLVYCYNSPLRFGHRIQDNEILVMAWDDCKQNEIKYKIKTKNTKKHIFQIAIIYQYQLDYSFETTYLYNLGFIGFGAGLIINKTNPGIKIVIQKGF